jgi:UDP:flavonoid glycosyltransferase YjiC (YdhE family)
MEVLMVTWQAGGGSTPAIGLGRLLASHGHRVRIVAPAAYADRVTAAGCIPRPLPAGAEFDPSLGRRMEEQVPFLLGLFFGLELPAAVAQELHAEPADVLVVDYLLRAVASLGEQLDIPHVLLIHTIFPFHGVAADEAALRREYELFNAARTEMGLAPFPVGPDTVTIALTRRAAGTIVCLPHELDRWPDPPAGVVHAGPIFEEGPAADWQSPWSNDDTRPLVAVSMGTTYMGHGELLGRVAEGLSDLDARVLILTGHELAPSEVAVREGVVVEGYVPHAAVLPGASLVVTHAGTGTLMAAFSAGVPVVCIPLGRDQPDNARRVEELGLGTVLSAEATASEIRQSVENALQSASLRDAALEMAAAIDAYSGGSLALGLLERIAGSAPGQAGDAPSASSSQGTLT